jgi:hypothetical protein
VLSLPGGWRILSLDLTPKGTCLCLSACWRDRAGVSFVTTQTERERLFHPREAGLHLRFPVSHLSAKGAERWGTLRLYVI